MSIHCITTTKASYHVLTLEQIQPNKFKLIIEIDLFAFTFLINPTYK